MLAKEVLYNYTHDTVAYGMVRDDTEEYYKTFNECKARGDALRADGAVAYVHDGYWWPTGNYRVAYAYKA